MTVISCATQRWLFSCIEAFDTANTKMGAERNRQKKEVVHNVPDLDNADPEWRVTDVRAHAAVATTTHGNSTPGVAVGPRQYVADQLLANADVT